MVKPGTCITTRSNMRTFKNFRKTIVEQQHKLTLVVTYPPSVDRTLKPIFEAIREMFKDKVEGHRGAYSDAIQYWWTTTGSRMDLIDIERMAKQIRSATVEYK